MKARQAAVDLAHLAPEPDIVCPPGVRAGDAGAAAGASALDGLVSVVTPAHNAAWCIGEAITCVADQSVAVLEHIIVDDGSTDGTADVVRDLQATFPHVVLMEQNRLGSAGARNLGIEHARGRYVAFLDSDDLWRERKLERQIGFMERVGVPFTYGDYERHEGRTGRRVGFHQAPGVVGYEDLLTGCPIGCLTAAYNQEVLGKLYMPEVRRGQDWGLWLRLVRQCGQARKFPGNEAIYRSTVGSLSAGKLSKCADIYRIYRMDERMSRAAALRSVAVHGVQSLYRRYRARVRARRPS